ncbi:MAG TPA: phosphoribosyltransferase family protein [Solirubrobacteraceae bacterium]|nr:phosphoribosyltransferase family protein [Solirubrobacteraceae bacterium]
MKLVRGPAFRDRRQAGRLLAEELHARADRDAIVLGLPRGGVPVAYEVARGLGARLDVYMVRKLGVPGHEELAFGAIARGGTRVIDQALVSRLELSLEELQAVERKERRELQRRERLYRADRPALALTDRAIVVVDDGLATGSSMLACALDVAKQRPRRTIIAVPVAPAATCAALQRLVDDVVCLTTPRQLRSVGWWYEDFSQVRDEEVQRLLASAGA